MAGSFVVAGGEGLVLLEFAEAAFDDVAAPVGGAFEAAECLAASSASADLVGAFGDGAGDAPFSQLGADLAGRVALVAGHPVGPDAGPAGAVPLDGDAGHDRLELRAVVDVPARDREGERPALPVTGEGDLRAQPTAGPAERLAGPGSPFRAPAACWWARTTVESTHTIDQSTSPTASECCWTWARSRSRTDRPIRGGASIGPTTAHV